MSPTAGVEYTASRPAYGIILLRHLTEPLLRKTTTPPGPLLARGQLVPAPTMISGLPSRSRSPTVGELSTAVAADPGVTTTGCGHPDTFRPSASTTWSHPSWLP